MWVAIVVLTVWLFVVSVLTLNSAEILRQQVLPTLKAAVQAINKLAGGP